jgi:hypothetical protein
MGKKPIYALSCALVFIWLSACGQTGVRPLKFTQAENLDRPTRILVYDFTVNEREVTAYRGIMRQQPRSKDPGAQRRRIAAEVKDAMAGEVVAGLRHLGFTAERVSRGTPASRDEWAIDGYVYAVDEGNPLSRLVVGFGNGASRVDAQVYVSRGGEAKRLLEFATHSDSGKLPGAAPTLGAGALVHGGVTVGMAATEAAISGVRTYQSDVARMAAASGEQAVRYLSEFFARQGWVRADQVKKARIAY